MVDLADISQFNEIQPAMRGDTEALIKLLRSDEPLQEVTRDFVASWIEQTRSPFRERGQRPDLRARYKQRDAAMLAHGLIRGEYEANGNKPMTQADACALVAEWYDYKPATVKKYLMDYRKKLGDRNSPSR